MARALLLFVALDHADVDAATALAPAGGHPPYHVEHERDEIRLSGDLRLKYAAELWQCLVRATRDVTGEVTFDLSGVHAIDGAVVALLVELQAELAARGVHAKLTGAGDRFAPLVQLYTGRDEPFAASPAPEGLFERLGRSAIHVRDELADVVHFFGRLAFAAGVLVKQPRSGHWSDVPRLTQQAGADALPIALTINALVGFAMSFQSAQHLERYGANLYVANLVGTSITRELAPLMTAIVVSGRSGAAYAAEIGTMKINEEIDALATLGIRPFNWLVIPRVIALLLVVPSLTLLADMVGSAGGLPVAVWDLELTPYGYFHQMAISVVGWDVATGLIKSVVFALAIAIISCQQGLATAGGAEGVGHRTTSTVVACLFVLAVLDALLNIIFRLFRV